MRLIDADKACEVLTDYYHLRTDIQRQALVEALGRVPTIDAEPVRRGRWLLEDNPDTGWYRIACSKCGEDVAPIAPCLGRVVTWDYCPYCGAKMEV